MGTYRDSAGVPFTGVRQIEIIFTPHGLGTTSANVVVATYSGPRRTLHRVGSTQLNVGRSDLVGLAPGEVTAVLVSHFHAWLSEERSTLLPRPKAPAPPAGATGAALQVPGQLSLNLDSRG